MLLSMKEYEKLLAYLHDLAVIATYKEGRGRRPLPLEEVRWYLERDGLLRR